MGRITSAGVGCHIAAQATESSSILEGGCGRGAVGGIVGCVDSLAARAGGIGRKSDEVDVQRSRCVVQWAPGVGRTAIPLMDIVIGLGPAWSRCAAGRESTSSIHDVEVRSYLSCRRARVVLLLTDW